MKQWYALYVLLCSYHHIQQVLDYEKLIQRVPYYNNPIWFQKKTSFCQSGYLMVIC